MTLIAALSALLQDLPMIGNAVKTIVSWFTKTPAQKQQAVATSIQSEETKINESGRPE